MSGQVDRKDHSAVQNAKHLTGIKLGGVMPEIGEIKKGYPLGLKSGAFYVWQACPICSKEYWVRLVKGEPRNLRCRPCASRETLKKIDNWGEIIVTGWVGDKIVATDISF